jgi:hypothetical protein
MTYYKITCVFDADWANLFPAIFGSNAQHSHSRNGDLGPNVAIYGFDTPQTPADLGPLVKVELIPNP